MTTPPASSWMDRLAHDLRGPLSPMQTAVYLLRDPQVGETERAELLAVMDRQLRRLGNMIDEISDVGRAENGSLLGRREAIALEQLVDDLMSRLQAQPPVVTFAAEALTAELDGDALRLGQMLHTLLGLQLSRAHPAPVHAHVDWTAPERLRIACTVKCREASEALVEALLTGPHPDPPDDGLGLGMLIAGAIAEAHGGSLRGQMHTPDSVELLLELPARPSA